MEIWRDEEGRGKILCNLNYINLRYKSSSRVRCTTIICNVALHNNYHIELVF